VADFYAEGSAWAWDERTGQYFLATFSPSQPDLNWRNPQVRKAVYDAMRFWLSRGADGFRLDMADFLGKDERLRDEAPLGDGWGMYEYLTRAKYQLNRPENLRYAREMRRVADEFGEDRMLVGQANYHLPVERLAAFGAPGLLDLAGNVRLTFLTFEAAKIRAFVDEYDAACTAAGAWPNWCLGNHDTPRASRLGPEGARLAAVLLLTLHGTPFLYYGDEIGMPTVEVPPEKRRDPWAHPTTGAGRDGARTPMQWDASPNAGFSGTTPWLPVDPGYRSVNVATQRGDPSSMLGLYRRLLRLRRETSALSSGDFEYLAAPEGCFLFARCSEYERVLVVLNFSGGGRIVPLPGAEVGATVRLSTRGDREGKAVLGSVHLAAWEGLVLTSGS